MTTILVMSENATSKHEIEQYLYESEFAVTTSDVEPFDRSLLTSIDLIILDVTSAKRDITDIIARLQASPLSIPMIAVIEQGNVQMAVQTLRSGAADVLEYPINKSALLQSVTKGLTHRDDFNSEQYVIQQAIDLLKLLQSKHSFARTSLETETSVSIPTQAKVLRIGELIINLDQVKVLYQRKPIELTPTQFRLLAYLGQARGRVVPFEELYYHLHEVQLDRSVARTALSAHLSNLRAHLNEVGCRDYLENIRGRGYSLNTPPKYQRPDDDAHLGLILDTLPIILWTMNVDCQITSVYGGGLSKLGLKPDELIGSDATAVFQFDKPISAQTDFCNLIQSGVATAFELILAHGSFYIRLEPNFDLDNRINRWVGLALDRSDRKPLE